MNPARPWIPQIVLALSLLGLLGGTVVLVAISRSKARSPWKGLDALLAQQRFDEVEQRLETLLRDRPEDLRANILMSSGS